MADEQSLRSRNAHSPSRPQNLPLCQSLRLGSSFLLSSSILSWSLVGRTIPAPYQHVGNNGHSFRTDKNLKIYSPFLCQWSHISTSKGELFLPTVWCLKHHIVVRIRHILGKFNVLGYRLSRIDKIVKTEWALDRSIANSIFQMFNLDMFATGFNHKLPL